MSRRRATVLGSLGVALALLFGTGRPTAAAESVRTPNTAQAGAILEATGVKGGLIVHVGCGDGRLTAALRVNEAYLVHGLDRDPKNVERAREHIRSLGLYGKVAVDLWRGGRLPYTDNLINLLVIEGAAPSAEEVQRVLAPEGVAYVKQGDTWAKTVKPRRVGTDEWTHAMHGPDNNLVAADTVVGPPHHLQWVGGPRWARSHDHLASTTVVVSSGGRLFCITDEGPIVAVALPPRWLLVARDAFNGVVLWKRPIERWEGHLRDFRCGPSNIRRRLVAVDDRLFVTLGYGEPVTALDAATGATLKTYAGAEGAEEIVYADGTLYLVLGDAADQRKVAAIARRKGNLTDPKRRIAAVNAKTGDVLWKRDDAATAYMMPLTLAVAGGRLFFHNSNDLVCLNAATGEEHWHTFRPLATRRPGWSTLTLVVHGDVVLCGDRGIKREVEAPGEPVPVTYAADRAGGNAPPGKLIAYAVKDGKQLWAAPCKETYNAPVDVLVADELVWTGNLVRAAEPGITQGRDVKTGEVKRTRPPDKKFFSVGMGHHRCHRNRATSRYLVMGRAGVEFIDLKTGDGVPNHWVRGVCQFGVIPCNGLLYAPPHSCACYIQAKLNGFNALAPKRKSTVRTAPPPLEKGPAFDATAKALSLPGRGLGEGPDPSGEQSTGTGEARSAKTDDPSPPPSPRGGEGDDWPTYRHDNARSGRTKAAVPAETKPTWRTALGGRLTSPVVADGRVFVAQVDAHTVHALRAIDGEPLWRYTAGGRVDSPPTIYDGLALFGSADGWVTCLRAADGALVWRFRGAPEDRRVVAYGQIESVWPIHGSVLVQNGEALFVAGRSSFLDGGMVLYRLDARTGKIRSRTVIDTRNPKTGREPPRIARGTNITAGSLPDVLSSDGESVFMRHVKFDLKGVRQKGGGPHLYAPAGFVDDSWWHRTYWMIGGRMEGGYGGWPKAAGQFPAGRILVTDGDAVYGFGRSAYASTGSHVGLSNTRYRLFAAGGSPASQPAARPAGGKGSLVTVANSKSLDPTGKPITVEAWVKPEKPDGVILARGATTHGYALLLKGGTPRFVIRANRKLGAVDAKEKIGDGWTHLAGVLTAEKSLSLYVNGRLAGTAKAPGLIAKEPGDATAVGADDNLPVGAYDGAMPFTGLIDEVRVYHRALTAGEIAGHAAEPEAGAADKALVLAFSFDKGDAADGSGKGNNGTPVGVTAVAGRVGQGMRFTGEAPPPSSKRRGRRPARGVPHRWNQAVPLIVRGMVLADKTLFLVGPPAPLTRTAAPPDLEAARTGLLMAVSPDDGSALSQQPLAAPPVWDGLVAVPGRLVLTLRNGDVLCLTGTGSTKGHEEGTAGTRR